VTRYRMQTETVSRVNAHRVTTGRERRTAPTRDHTPAARDVALLTDPTVTGRLLRACPTRPGCALR
jgi:hypothetical protein